MAWRASGLRLFGFYALASAIPIGLLGVGLAHQYQTQMNRRALDQAASEADAIANAGIEPVLAGRELAPVQDRLDPGVCDRVGFARGLVERAPIHLRLVLMCEPEAEEADRDRAREHVPAEQPQPTRAPRHTRVSAPRKGC